MARRVLTDLPSYVRITVLRRSLFPETIRETDRSPISYHVPLRSICISKPLDRKHQLRILNGFTQLGSSIPRHDVKNQTLPSQPYVFYQVMGENF